MQNKQFTLRYLLLFHQDLLKTALYITDVLGNPDAAEKLIDDVMEVRRFLYNPQNIDNIL